MSIANAFADFTRIIATDHRSARELARATGLQDKTILSIRNGTWQPKTIKKLIAAERAMSREGVGR